MTPDPCKRPSDLPVFLGIGLWIFVVSAFSVLIPGQASIGFVVGAVLGWPAFFPMDRHVRRSASAEMFRRCRLEQRAFGPDGDFEGRQRRMEVLNKLKLGEATTKAVALVGRYLKWVPCGLFAFVALACLVAGWGSEGPGSTAAGVFGGAAAVFALMTGRRVDQPIPSPWDESGRPIQDLRGL